MDPSSEASEFEDYTLRVMPGWPLWRRWPMLFVLPWPFLMGYEEYRGWPGWAMVATSVALIAAAFGAERLNRCPQCRRFIRPQTESTGPRSYGRFYVCDLCKILWDPQIRWAKD